MNVRYMLGLWILQEGSSSDCWNLVV